MREELSFSIFCSSSRNNRIFRLHLSICFREKGVQMKGEIKRNVLLNLICFKYLKIVTGDICRFSNSARPILVNNN